MASIVEVVTASATTATVAGTLSATPASGDRIVVAFTSLRGAGARTVSSVTGGGGSWSAAYTSGRTAYWKSDNPSASGTITLTQSGTGAAIANIYLIRGAAATYSGAQSSTTGTSLTGPSQNAGSGQVVIVTSTTIAGTQTFPSSSTPSGGWTTESPYSNGGATASTSARVPTENPATAHTLSMTSDTSGFMQLGSLTVGDLAAPSTPSGDGSGVFSWSGAAVGKKVAAGVAAGAFAWSGAAVGSADLSGEGSGSFAWSGAASGTTPAVDSASGSGSGAFDWTGGASGSTVRSGSGSGAFAWDGAASGTGLASTPSGSGSGAFDWTGSAAGTGSTPYPTTFTIVRTPTPVGGSASAALLPAAVPAPWNAHPVTVTAHPMPAITPSNPRVKPGIDYTPLRGVAGRLHLFVDGVDETFHGDVPLEIDDWSSSDPFGDDGAQFTMRQIGPGDPSPFDMDADPIVDIAFVAEDGTLTHLWDGQVVSEQDTTTATDEARVYTCEGTLKAAAHARHMPPTILDATDIGVVIPRVLNAVPNRRYATIAETVTGITTTLRGSQDDSSLSYVLKLLATAFTESGVQWTLGKLAPRHYGLVLKDDTANTAEVVKGAVGVEVNVTRDESMRWDGLYGEGVAPNGGHWGNWFFPGLDLFVPPAYPYADTTQTIGTGDTDAGTTTGDGVTVAQRRLVELGYPVNVDGTFNALDSEATARMQRAFGLLVDGIIGPQTWTALFVPGLDEIDLQAVRLPLASKPWVLPHTYAANGAVTGDNPDHDPRPVPHLPNIKFGADITKADATVLARRMLAANGVAAWVGSITLTSDPVNAAGVPFSRFLLREGDRIKVTGHDGDKVLRVADASKDGLTVRVMVDERNRSAMTLDAIAARDREARTQPDARPGSPSKISSLTRDHIVQFESESQAGQIPFYPVNGNVGLWSVFPIVVSQTGRIAELEMTARSATTTFVVAFFGKPIQPQRLAAMVPDPIASNEGWYDHAETLILDHAWIDTFGNPGSLGGYWPWQQKDGRAVTGVMRDDSGLEFRSEMRGYLWVAVFSSASTIVNGRAYPAVPS